MRSVNQFSDAIQWKDPIAKTGGDGIMHTRDSFKMSDLETKQESEHKGMWNWYYKKKKNSFDI